jgi:hypothetical protein
MMKITVPRMLLIIAIEILVLLILAACVLRAQDEPSVRHVTVPPTEYPKFGPQIVMTVDHEQDGKRYVVPKAVIWYRLTPLSGPTAKSPLAKGDAMLCNAFDMKDQEGGMHIAEKCGEDVYLVDMIGMKPPKE